MKNVLMASAAIALLTASIAYYFVVFLPHQSQSKTDISAIGAVVAPTPKQLAQQRAAAQQTEAEVQAKVDAHLKCVTDMTQKGNAYIGQQCPSSTTDMIDYRNCSEKV